MPQERRRQRGAGPSAARRPASTWSTTPTRATHVLINTCGFTGEAKEESIGAILGAARDYPAAELLVMGCLVQRYREELESGLPEVSRWYGLGETAALVGALDLPPRRPRTVPLPDPPPRTRRSFAYVKISDGCDHRCSFCAIPGIKGPYAALPLDEIMEQAHAALDAGARELVLVGQDTDDLAQRGPGSGRAARRHGRRRTSALDPSDVPAAGERGR